MPLFARQPHPNAQAPGGHLADATHRPVSNGRPASFGHWIRMYGIDILTMAALGAVGLGVYEAKPAPSRSFPITFSDVEVVYPQFAYPLRKNIIPIWLAALLAWIVPTFFFLVMQIRVRSFWRDLHAAEFGLLYSLITGAVFQVFIKWLIGGLRPHFLAVCLPDVSALGNGYHQIMFQRDVCTGDQDEIDDSLESMPSGHSTAAGAGFVFLALYFNAHLKVFGPGRTAMWRMVLFFAPLLGACLIAGSLTIDEYHNWYDCLAGLLIGTACAFAAYRTQYSAIWDWRYNHVPLPLDVGEYDEGGHAAEKGSRGVAPSPAPLAYPAAHEQRV